MSKQANKKVTVHLKNIRICSDSPHMAQWIYQGIHQKFLSRKELKKLSLGHKLKLMTINPPKKQTVKK